MSTSWTNFFRLRRRKPEAWLALLSDIEPADLRIQTAAIIWWDYYSGREVVEGWPHLDGYIGAWNREIRIPPVELRAALVQCGYTPKLAEERVPDNHSLFRSNDQTGGRLRQNGTGTRHSN